jgi:hypothetical protein
LSASHGKRDLGAQQVHLCALEIVQRSHLRDGQQAQGRVGCAGLVCGLRRGKRALRPELRLGRQFGGPCEEGGRRAQTAARLRAAGRAFELRGDILVGPRCRLGAMPGPAIGIGSRIGGLGESTVGDAPVASRRRLVDGRADQRVAENDPGPNGQ